MKWLLHGLTTNLSIAKSIKYLNIIIRHF